MKIILGLICLIGLSFANDIKEIREKTEGVLDNIIVENNSLVILGYKKHGKIYDMYLEKSDLKGKKIWSKTYNTKNAKDDTYSRYLFSNDKTYTLFGTNYNSKNRNWMLIVDKNGKKLKERFITMETYFGKDAPLLKGAIQTSDGGYLLSLYYYPKTMALLKLDQNGKNEWEKIFNFDRETRFRSIIEYKSNFLIFRHTYMENSFNVDSTLVSISKKGDIISETPIGVSSIVEKAIKTSDGNIMFLDYSPFLKTLVVKITPKGRMLGEILLNGKLETIKETKDKGFILVGAERRLADKPSTDHWKNAVITKINKKGRILWEKVIGYDALRSLYDVVELKNKYIAVGTAKFVPGIKKGEEYLYKVDINKSK
ncbi:MAG: hypothetical protein CSA86_00665 [Arcobacter sp.]|nr:MAG: hypothetical protein CSA86_00665 [Arcobacter sp.]